MCNEREDRNAIEYRVVPDFPDRLVGVDGSYWRRVTLSKRPGCYVRTQLGFSRKTGQSVFNNLHTIVLTTFIGPRPEGKEGCHNDGNPCNNQLGNLRWDTHISNGADMISHGRAGLNRGSAVPSSKLTESQVLEIRRLASKGVLHRELAEQFGVSRSTIGMIVQRKRWDHLPDPQCLIEARSRQDDSGATD